MSLTNDERRLALRVAEEAIRARLTGRRPLFPSGEDVPGTLSRPGASFVTLERGDRLLGCRGTLEAREPLLRDIAQNAVLTAFHDPRFGPISEWDFVVLSLKLSVLSPPRPTQWGSFGEAIGSVRPGIDGLVVRVGQARATLLPSVWEHIPAPGPFLAALWEKAGLAPGYWPPGTIVYRYVTEEFTSAGPRDLNGHPPGHG